MTPLPESPYCRVRARVAAIWADGSDDGTHPDWRPAVGERVTLTPSIGAQHPECRAAVQDHPARLPLAGVRYLLGERLDDGGLRAVKLRDVTTGQDVAVPYSTPGHDTRTVTSYDASGKPIGTRPYTAAENAEADAALADAARLDDLAARVARIEAHLWPAPDDPTTPDDPAVADWAALGGIWPDQGLLREGGIIWRNVSGVPLTTPPSGFPGAASQWERLFVVALAPEPPAPTVAAWSATTTYTVGARCTKDGRVWECLVAHGPERQGTWAPGPATPTVWRDIGPA